MITRQEQLELFGRTCWGTNDLFWQTLERDEMDRDTNETLEYLEGYTGKLPAETVLIPVQVLYVPGTNFFLMPLMRGGSDDDET